MKLFRLFNVTAAKGSASAGNILFQGFLLAALSLSDVGAINYTLAVTMGFGVLLRGGMDIALLRDASLYWRTGKKGVVSYLVKNAMRNTLVRALLLGVLTWAFFSIGSWHSAITAREAFEALVLATLFTGLLLLSAALKSVGKIAFGSWVEQGQPFLIAGATGLVLWKLFAIHMDAYLILIASTIVVLLIGTGSLVRVIAEHPAEEADISGKSGLLFLVSFFQYVSQWGIILLLKFFVTNEDLGIFSTALRFSMGLNFLLMVSNQFIVPKISAYYRTGQIAELASMVRSAASYLFFTGVGFLLVLSLSVWLFDFGTNTKSIIMVALVCLTGQLVNVSTGATGYMLAMTGHEGLWLKSLVAGVVIGVAGIFLAGIAGAPLLVIAIAYAFIPVITTVMSVIYVKKIFNFYSLPYFSYRMTRQPA